MIILSPRYGKQRDETEQWGFGDKGIQAALESQKASSVTYSMCCRPHRIDLSRGQNFLLTLDYFCLSEVLHSSISISISLGPPVALFLNMDSLRKGIRTFYSFRHQHEVPEMWRTDSKTSTRSQTEEETMTAMTLTRPGAAWLQC